MEFPSWRKWSGGLAIHAAADRT